MADRTPLDPEPTDAEPTESGRPEPDERAPTATGGPHGGLRRTVVAVLLLAALLGLVAVAIVQRGRIGDLQDDADAPDEVARAAGTFAEAYLTYDSADVDASTAAVRPLLTEAFAREYKDDRSPGLEAIFEDLDTRTSVEVVDVFVGDVDDERARVLVVVDLEASGDPSGTQRLHDLSFVVDLVAEGDRWLVDGVAPGPQPSVSGDGTDTGSG